MSDRSSSSATHQTYLSPLPRLRVGSTFVTRSGIRFRVCDAVVVVAPSGGESPSVWVERTKDSPCLLLFMTVGILANLVRGAAHRPGPGARIDWAQIPRRTQESVHRPSDGEPASLKRRSLVQPIWNARVR
jgi:hypothetical protein